MLRKGRYQAALDDVKLCIEADPEDPENYSKRAKFLLISDDDKIRDGKRALIDARRACSLTGWKDTNHLAVFAAAHAEIGNTAEAVKYQEMVVALLPEESREFYQKIAESYRAGKTMREIQKEQTANDKMP